MVNVNEAVIARLKKSGKVFEVLVDCDLALAFKEGKISDLDEVVVSIEIYEDSRKGMVAAESSLEAAFGTIDKKLIVALIIKDGEVQLTAEHRKKLREQKRKQIINLIHRNAVDPKTDLPHPPQRIENALVEVKAHIDDLKPAEQQVKDLVNKLKEVLPLKYEIREVQVIVEPQYSGRVIPLVRKYGKILNEEWMNDGSLNVVLELPAGLQEEFEREMNNLTHGNLNMNIMKVR